MPLWPFLLSLLSQPFKGNLSQGLSLATALLIWHNLIYSRISLHFSVSTQSTSPDSLLSASDLCVQFHNRCFLLHVSKYLRYVQNEIYYPPLHQHFNWFVLFSVSPFGVIMRWSAQDGHRWNSWFSASFGASQSLLWIGFPLWCHFWFFSLLYSHVYSISKSF